MRARTSVVRPAEREAFSSRRRFNINPGALVPNSTCSAKMVTESLSVQYPASERSSVSVGSRFKNGTWKNGVRVMSLDLDGLIAP